MLGVEQDLSVRLISRSPLIALEARVLKIIGVLLIVWIAISVLGAVVKGLFWLTIVGVVLFVGTAAYGALKGGSRKELR